jgi:hypothetical protein
MDVNLAPKYDRTLAADVEEVVPVNVTGHLCVNNRTTLEERHSTKTFISNQTTASDPVILQNRNLTKRSCMVSMQTQTYK